MTVHSKTNYLRNLRQRLAISRRQAKKGLFPDESPAVLRDKIRTTKGILRKLTAK
jgi:hypothetical protein